MIRCEIEKLGEGKCKTHVNIKGESDLLLNELDAIVAEIFAAMAQVIPFEKAEKLMLTVLSNGMKDGACKAIMGSEGRGNHEGNDMRTRPGR
jgi:hypothetical protein